MSLSGLLQYVADVREALKSVISAMTVPLYMTTSDLSESALSSVGQGSDKAKDKGDRRLANQKMSVSSAINAGLNTIAK